MRIALITAPANRPELLDGLPSEADRWLALLGKKEPKWRFEPFVLGQDKLPKSNRRYHAWVFAGTLADDAEHPEARSELYPLIREVVTSKKPVLGVGFGHLAIAKALGGECAQRVEGWVVGSAELEIFAANPWMKNRRTWLFGAYQNQLTRLPDGARPLVRTLDGTVVGFSIGANVLTQQLQPELDRETIRIIIDRLEPSLSANEIDHARNSLPFDADRGVFADWLITFLAQKKNR